MNTEELNMKHSTPMIIEALRADGEPKLLLLAADRLEELQRLNESMQVDRDLWIKVGREKLEAVERERNEARAEVGRFSKIADLMHIERDKAQEQRDEADAEVERLKKELEEIKRSLRESVETRNKNFEKLIEARAEVATLKDAVAAYETATVKQSLTVRPEPSRLEIAALFMTSSMHPTGGVTSTIGERMKWAIAVADALIAAAAARGAK